jgi:hypothetical protein
MKLTIHFLHTVLSLRVRGYLRTLPCASLPCVVIRHRDTSLTFILSLSHTVSAYSGTANRTGTEPRTME